MLCSFVASLALSWNKKYALIFSGFITVVFNCNNGFIGFIDFRGFICDCEPKLNWGWDEYGCVFVNVDCCVMGLLWIIIVVIVFLACVIIK